MNLCFQLVSYDILKVKHFEEMEELKKKLNELKEEKKLESEVNQEEINGLKRKVTQIEIALKAAEENVESQQQLITELSMYKIQTLLIAVNSFVLV